MVNLRDLEILCEVAGQRSFSKAARRLEISQSVVSETVKGLEDHLGSTLIDRTQRPLALTPAGRVYVDGCRDLLESARCLEDRVRQLHHQVVGPVRVSAIYSVGLLQMDCYVKQFERLYPDAVLELRYLHPQAVLDRVLNDESDLGLMSFPPKKAELICTPWQNQEIVAVVYPGHRLAGRRTMRACELEGEPLVSYTPELAIRQELDRHLKQARVHVEVVHEFDNIENIKRAVEIGSGIALLPVPTVRREIEIGSLRAVHFEDVQWHRPLSIVHKRQRVHTTAVRRFLDLLGENPDTFAAGAPRAARAEAASRPAS